MPFRAPNFNLVCNIWGGSPPLPLPPAGAPRIANQACQLALDHSNAGIVATRYRLPSLVRMPARTDVRSFLCPTGFDAIEVPVGSGNWFYVDEVVDVARGFTNEYRMAVAIPVQVNVPMT